MCIRLINIIIRLSERIRNESFLFVIIIIFLLIIAPLLLDHFIDDGFYKIITYIPIPIVIIYSFQYCFKNQKSLDFEDSESKVRNIVGELNNDK